MMYFLLLIIAVCLLVMVYRSSNLTTKNKASYYLRNLSLFIGCVVVIVFIVIMVYLFAVEIVGWKDARLDWLAWCFAVIGPLWAFKELYYYFNVKSAKQSVSTYRKGNAEYLIINDENGAHLDSGMCLLVATEKDFTVTINGVENYSGYCALTDMRRCNAVWAYAPSETCKAFRTYNAKTKVTAFKFSSDGQSILVMIQD